MTLTSYFKKTALRNTPHNSTLPSLSLVDFFQCPPLIGCRKIRQDLHATSSFLEAFLWPHVASSGALKGVVEECLKSSDFLKIINTHAKVTI